MMTDQSTGSEAGWLSRIRNSSFGLTLIALAGIAAGVASTTEAVDKIAISVGLKKNSLQLAQDDEKAKFSRELIRLTWQRLYLMRRYVLAIEQNYSSAERDKDWDRYLAVLEAWNRDLMVNILGLNQHYGEAKSADFEHGIQPQFGALHYCLESLHTQGSKLTCKLSSTKDLGAIKRGLDGLNVDLYCFVRAIDAKNQACHVGRGA
jgi:hypothetical protein